MSFAAWCLCQSFDIRHRLDAAEQCFYRRLFAVEARSAREAMLARYVSRLGKAIVRDILENRVEA